MRSSITLALGVAGAIFAYNVASAEDVITLGAAVSETGKYSTNGVFTEKGYQLAVDKINSQGGVKVGGKTYKLAVKFYDDESSPARGAELVDRLIKQDGIKFILGPYSSGLTKAIAPETEKLQGPDGGSQRRGAFAVHQRLQVPVRHADRPPTSISPA